MARGSRGQAGHRGKRMGEESKGITDVYMDTAKILYKFANHQGGLKALALSDEAVQSNKTATYSLAFNTLLRYKSLMAVAPAVPMLPDTQSEFFFLHLVLLYEGLCGKGINNQERRRRKLNSTTRAAYKSVLMVVDDIKADFPTKPTEDEAAFQRAIDRAHHFPRSLRVNPTVLTRNQALGLYANAKPDPVLPDVLLAPKDTPIRDDKNVASGAVTVQSRASCLPVSALFDVVDRDKERYVGSVLDFCAAPGNKTTHAAVRLAQAVLGKGLRAKGGNKSVRKVYSVTLNEIDPRRAELAEKLTAPVTATLPAAVRVVARVGSCLDLTCAPVEGCEPPTLCVVDPSCSSSGVVGNPDKRFGAMFGETTDLAGLAEFQHSCLTHAMGLETVQAIAYSTCSVHDEENEEVVRRALQTVPGWKPAYPLSAWERRGHGDDEVARCSIKTDPEQDQTDGFYVCVLVRDVPEDED
ncbi:RNA (C5-cytosine) methyltransferase [Carpediemonas membranifera]|uniref:RNA (C5-cytosine) methyltransferase n=1 Tax=Carpediemonas membranifera TaxID=201153 RepID=A0A8J6ASF0_9EUKA|nr:RNA (C5-cytosine) methyltransferase [Carpediemonas membranifera]|eukprot:KAG9391160.1 RNA (C5-cytosine) methyltransferase [Carpediemonas membranifera]